MSETGISEGLSRGRRQRMMRLEGRMVLGSEGDGYCIAPLEEREWVGSELSWNWGGRTKRTGILTWADVFP